jgi:hypothetical protein
VTATLSSIVFSLIFSLSLTAVATDQPSRLILIISIVSFVAGFATAWWLYGREHS